MKGLKKIGLIALSLAFATVVTTGCSKKDDDSTSTVQTTQTSTTGTGIVVEDTDTEFLNSITLDTSETTRVFYLGQEFNSDGLKVIKSIRVTAADGTIKGYNQEYTDDFTVDTDEVDMLNLGTYTVNVSVRIGTRILTKSYEIQVKSSRFETTPGLIYNAGLEVSYADSTTIKRYLVTNATNDTYTETFDKDTLLKGLKIKLHKKEVNANGTETSDYSETELSLSDVTIDEAIDINTKGTYKIEVTYHGDSVNIDGTEYSNDVHSFLIVSVENPISRLSMLNSNVSEFQASVNDIDFENAGWQVRITPTVGKGYSVPFTYDQFTVSNLDLFYWNKEQSITITENEEGVSCEAVITITESETQNIKSYYDLTPTVNPAYGTNGYDETGKPIDLLLAGASFIHGPQAYKIDTTQYYDSGATYTTGRSSKDVYGSISFETRLTVKGSSQAIKIEMPTEGDIVVFFASTADEERDLAIYDEKDGAINEQIDAATSSGKKQEITRATFHVSAAGTYYIANPSGGLYIHGFIIATAK